MIDTADLKNILHRDLSRLAKLLIILAATGKALSVAEIRQLGRNAGLRQIKDWNISDILGRSKGKAILVGGGWELTAAGNAEAAILLAADIETKPPPVADDLRVEMAKIKDPTTLAFVTEAVQCYEHKLYRSAIVMSWLSAVGVLYRHVVVNRLADFNAEATRVFGNKWKPALNEDDLALMGERDFLDRIAHLSIIGKNVKADLIASLERRNGCGHPNSLKVGRNAVAYHIETLIKNVFQPFA